MQKRREWTSCQGEDTNTQNPMAQERIVHTCMVNTEEVTLSKETGFHKHNAIRGRLCAGIIWL